jgi:pSer/pThr/pTyr-binding forkhead associated (FHA) protein
MNSITIRYRVEGGSPKTFTSSKRNVNIGRGAAGVDVDLSPDERVDPEHARVYYHLNGWWVESSADGPPTYLNGEPVTEPTILTHGDRIQVGGTTLRVELTAQEQDVKSGLIKRRLDADEASPSPISEDKRLELFARISNIVAFSQSRQSMLEGFLREIADAFPQAERRTLLLIEDGEMVPRAFWPPTRAAISFTLARQAIQTQQAFQWNEEAANASPAPLPESLLDTKTALYAPMMCSGKAVGVLHVDASTSRVSFREEDLQLLGIIANTIGGALKAELGDGFAYFPKVFISYSHQDREWVNRLAADLRRRRIRAWFDERMKTGEAWRKQLTRAIGETDAFLLILTPQSVESKEVLWELSIAHGLTKRVFPLLYRDCEVPDTIAHLQYVSIGANYEIGLNQIVDELYTTGHTLAP